MIEIHLIVHIIPRNAAQLLALQFFALQFLKVDAWLADSAGQPWAAQVPVLHLPVATAFSARMKAAGRSLWSCTTWTWRLCLTGSWRTPSPTVSTRMTRTAWEGEWQRSKPTKRFAQGRRWVACKSIWIYVLYYRYFQAVVRFHYAQVRGSPAENVWKTCSSG